MAVNICNSCGHIEFGPTPVECPVCGAKKFNQNDNIFKESEEKSKEAAPKHVPAITVKKECSLIPDMGCIDVLVVIGQKIHPMEEKHFIQFIDCYVDDKYVSRQFLSPGVYAGGLFHLKAKGSKVRIVENCNLHGYWTAEAAL
jgi:desulfoferrodoxin-like iron-binding protein